MPSSNPSARSAGGSVSSPGHPPPERKTYTGLCDPGGHQFNTQLRRVLGPISPLQLQLFRGLCAALLLALPGASSPGYRGIGLGLHPLSPFLGSQHPAMGHVPSSASTPRAHHSPFSRYWGSPRTHPLKEGCTVYVHKPL